VVANRAIDPALAARATSDLQALDTSTHQAVVDALAPVEEDRVARVVTEVIACATRMAAAATAEHERLTALVVGLEGIAVLRAPMQSTDVTALDDLVALQRGFVPVAIG
jgi:hypothetical protein